MILRAITWCLVIYFVVPAAALAQNPNCEKPASELDYAEAAKDGKYTKPLLVFQLKRIEKTVGDNSDYVYCSSRMRNGSATTICNNLSGLRWTTGQDQLVVETEEGFRYILRCKENCKKAAIVPGCWYSRFGSNGWEILEKRWTYDKKTKTPTPRFDSSTWSIYGSLGKEADETTR